MSTCPPHKSSNDEDVLPKTQGDIMFGVDEDSIDSFKLGDDHDDDFIHNKDDQKMAATDAEVDMAALEDGERPPPSQGELMHGVEEDSLASFDAGDSYRAGLSATPIYLATVSAPTNIAVVKYWGKANVEYNTPINDSLSVTLDQGDLKAITTVAASLQFKVDRLWLNGVEDESAATNKRFRACIDGVKALATDKVSEEKDGSTAVLMTTAQWQKDVKFHVSSYNTFPTAAGLASSAAGYAALVAALAKLMNAKEEFPGQLSTIARQGSGSACRSLYGGFVAWRMGGNKPDCSDSLAEQVADEHSWPEMRAVIMVVSDVKKDTSSTAGMGTSVATSALLAHRAKTIVPSVMEGMEKAILAKDFESFAKLTMQDSNQFHAVCLDTYPPIFYMNDTSRRIVRLVHAYNDWSMSLSSGGGIRAAYTFDAGPNAVLYTLEQHVVELGALMVHYFPPASSTVASHIKHAAFRGDVDAHELDASLLAFTSKRLGIGTQGDVKMVYYTRAGPGPREMEEEDANLDPRTGLNVYGIKNT